MTRPPRRRRWSFGVLVLAMVAAVGWLLYGMLAANGMQLLEWAVLALSVLLLVPIAMSFWIAVFGSVVERRGDPLALDAGAVAVAGPPLPFRVAVVMPVYHEDPRRFLAGLRASHDSLLATGQLDAFDLFVLSDTQDPQRWLDEEQAVAALQQQLPDPARLHYRNRADNSEKKAGNIADFCRHWGSRYECMIVLDADSVMSGATLVRLARLMAQNPRLGIVQAPPVPVNATSLFSRLQQFAARAYGPTWAAGLAWLQGGEGNYYGHNAILRIAPFAEHCRLPRLSGAAPLGGSILSHDFVEAALMRRAGWLVYLLHDIDGSYEELPPTIVDHAARSRRWCQGNLQHARLLGMPGLHAMSRLHLAMGVMSYVAAPLWLLLLIAWSAQAVWQEIEPHQYFQPGSLFPVWEVSMQSRAILLFVLVMLLLFVPRALAVLSRRRDPRERQLFGGGRGLLRSFACECLLSTLVAPVLMLEDARFVIGILFGSSVGWNAQARGERGIGLGEALRRHGGITLLGLLWAAVLVFLAPAMLWWLLPVLAGMLLAVPTSILTSRPALGRWSRRRGLLLTPEETAPEPVLRRLDELLAQAPAPAVAPAGSALERVLADPELRQLHLGFVGEDGDGDPLAAHQLEGLVLKCRLHGPATLSASEQRLLLRSPRAVLELAAARADAALPGRR